MRRQPKNQEIIPPVDGWVASTWYLVDVSYCEGNPIHRSLFYSGFLDDGEPSGYNGLVPANGPDFEEAPTSIQRIKYLKVVRVLLTKDEQ